jgi:hypothetical protein
MMSLAQQLRIAGATQRSDAHNKQKHNVKMLNIIQCYIGIPAIAHYSLYTRACIAIEPISSYDNVKQFSNLHKATCK